MKKRSLLIFSLVALTLGACRETNQTVTPDLTTSLVGQLNATYLIVKPGSQPNSLSGPALVQFDRKNNNTLLISITINDGAVRLNEQYDAVVTPEDLSNDGLRKPGLRNLFRLESNAPTHKGPSTTIIYSYNNGKILGGVCYVSLTDEIISLAF